METKKYSRRPFDVVAVRVTKTNMDEVAVWCSGEVVETPAKGTARAERFIQVDVPTPANERQSRAFPGDYVLLLEGGKSFKVYTTKAFNKNFVLSEDQSETPSQPSTTKKATKRPARKQTQPKQGNGLKPEAREALRKMGEGMKKASEQATEQASKVTESFQQAVEKATTSEQGKDETPAQPVELTPEQTPTHSHEAELQVVERPVENTTEPKLEVTEKPAEQPEKKRKFIQN